MATSEDDSTRQETPSQPLDVTTDRPSKDARGDDGVDSKPSESSPIVDDSSLDSCTSESSSPGSSTDDAASEASESGLSEDDHDTKATGSNSSKADFGKKPDGPNSGDSPTTVEETSSDDGNLADVSILTDAESPETVKNATEGDIQKPSDEIDAASDAVPNNYVSKSSQTDDGPQFDKESDNAVDDNNLTEDNQVPATDQTPEPSDAGDVPEASNEPENDNVYEADNSTPVDGTPEPSEAGDAPEVDDEPADDNTPEVDNDADAGNYETANKTPEPSEAGDAPTESERYEDSDITKRLREMDDKSPSRKQWILRKEKFGKDNEALDQLMLKYGLEEVKAHFVWVYDQRQRARGRDDVLWDLTNMHTCFLEGGENSMYTGSVLLPG